MNHRKGNMRKDEWGEEIKYYKKRKKRVVREGQEWENQKVW